MKLKHYSKSVSSTEIETNDIRDLEINNGNVYESINIIAKRANKISEELKKELTERVEDFTFSNDVLEEVFENKEQIRISKLYEKVPRSNLIALEEFKTLKIKHKYIKEN